MWQKGENAAFDILYKRYVVELVKTAAQKTNCVETSKELVQDIFLYVFQHPDKIDPDNSFKGYLFTALRNKVYNYYRQLAVRQKHEQQLILDRKSILQSDPAGSLQHKELIELVNHHVNELPEKCRTVFILSREEQLSHKEIADRMNISVNTVEQHMRKALNRLRTSLVHYLYIFSIMFLIK